MNRFRVLVHASYLIEVVAPDRDAAAEAALAELNRSPESLTHSGEIIRRQEEVRLVHRETVTGKGGTGWAA